MPDHLRGPCQKCPFQKGCQPAALKGLTSKDTMLSAISETGFECYETRGHGSTNRHECAGRLMFAKKNGKKFLDDAYSNHADLLTARLGNDNIMNVVEFATHHNPPTMFVQKKMTRIKIRRQSNGTKRQLYAGPRFSSEELK